MTTALVPAKRRLSPRVAIAIAVVVCALLAAGYWALLRTGYAVLATGVRPAEAAAIVAELDAKGVPHRLRDDGTTVLVPENQVDDLRIAVAGSELPIKGAVGFELFNKSDMGLTDFAQKINYQRALQGELARTIMMIDGIETARVHLAIPERSLFRQGEARAKAAIEVIVAPGFTLSPERVDGIRQLVAAAVPDLPASEVVVLDGDGRLASGTIVDPADRAPETDQRTAAQNYYAARARAVLAQQLPGVDIAVHALAVPAAEGAAASEGRDFTLRLTVVTPTALDTEEQRLAHDAVAAAAGLREGSGDTLTFEIGPTRIAAAPDSVPVIAPTLSAVPASSEPRPSVGRWIVAAIAIGLAVAIMMILRRRRQTLLGAEHAFAARVRARLEAPGIADARG